MLFNAKINEIQSQVNANSLEIEALLLRIEELRAQNLSLENLSQQLGSAEAAAESAIEQIRTALTMITVISPAEVTTFKSAIDSLFDSPRAELPASVDPEPEPPAPDENEAVEPETAEIAPESASEQIIEVTATPIDDNVQNLAPETNGNGHHPQTDLKTLLEAKTIVQLRKLLRARNASDKGNKQQLIDRLIAEGNITAADL